MPTFKSSGSLSWPHSIQSAERRRQFKTLPCLWLIRISQNQYNTRYLEPEFKTWRDTFMGSLWETII